MIKLWKKQLLSQARRFQIGFRDTLPVVYLWLSEGSILHNAKMASEIMRECLLSLFS